MTLKHHCSTVQSSKRTWGPSTSSEVFSSCQQAFPPNMPPVAKTTLPVAGWDVQSFRRRSSCLAFLLHLLLSLGNPCFKFKSLSGSNFQTGSALSFFLLALLDVKLEHAWNSETVLSALCLLNFLTSFFMPLKLFPYSFTRLAIFKVVFWKTFEPPL